MSYRDDNPCLKIFVGSSSEAAQYYEHVCSALEELGHDVRGWKVSFGKGEGFLAALLRMAEEVDAALLVATPDDVLHRRGEQSRVLRDNVLFEAGLFIGALGPISAGIVVAGADAVLLPTDLAGISTFSFREDKRHVFARDVREWVDKGLVARPRREPVRRAAAAIRGIPDRFLDDVRGFLLPRIETMLMQASRGIIELTPEQYFERIRFEIENASASTRVIAVASPLSTVRWANDPVQNYYVEQNFLARERGADIRRLFLFEKSSVTATQARSMHNHMSHGIPVRCISVESLSVPIDDIVLFESDGREARAYKAHADRTYRDRVVSAQMLIDPAHCSDVRRRFDEIWRLAWEPRFDRESIEIPGMRIPPPAKHQFAPGLEMTARWTSVEVITCRSAAKARGHELHRELKSLVLMTSEGTCVVHAPGDCTISLRKVKRHLKADEAYIADPEQLLELGLGPGTVCAVLDPVWSMRHLVDERVLQVPEVVTNNGTRNGYFTFDPDELRSARRVSIGDFVDRCGTESEW